METFTRGRQKQNAQCAVSLFPNDWKIFKYYRYFLGVVFYISNLHDSCLYHLTRTFPDNLRLLFPTVASQGSSIRFSRNRSESFTSNRSHMSVSEFGKFRDVTENCRSSASHLAEFYYEFISDPIYTCVRVRWQFSNLAGQTYEENHWLRWTINLAVWRSVFCRQTGLIDVYRVSGLCCVALRMKRESRNLRPTIARDSTNQILI